MAKDATDQKLMALLKRFQRLAEELARTHAESAETRQLVEAVQRRIARARAALGLAPVECARV